MMKRLLDPTVSPAGKLPRTRLLAPMPLIVIAVPFYALYTTFNRPAHIARREGMP